MEEVIIGRNEIILSSSAIQIISQCDDDTAIKVLRNNVDANRQENGYSNIRK